MHPPKRNVAIKFGALLAILFGYFGYLAITYDLRTGLVVAAIAWSFFVLCTPIADAGFLLDFPLRLLFGIRMAVLEGVVWLLAFAINAGTLFLAPSYYDTTLLTRLFHQILTTPYPYWAIILLSAAGTFLSIRFADEMLDVLHHRDRDFFHSHQLKHDILLLLFFVVAVVAYYKLMAMLNLSLP